MWVPFRVKQVQIPGLQVGEKLVQVALITLGNTYIINKHMEDVVSGDKSWEKGMPGLRRIDD